MHGRKLLALLAALTGFACLLPRIGVWLLVEDNNACGGSMVTFTGLYRRKR